MREGVPIFAGELRRVIRVGALNLAIGEIVMIVGRKMEKNGWDDDPSIDPGEYGFLLKVLTRKGTECVWEHLVDNWSERVFDERG